MANALISAKIVVPNPCSLAVRWGRRSDTSLSVGGSSSLELSEVLGPERVRQQFVQGERRPYSVRSGGVDGSVALGELAQPLPASAAAGPDGFAVADGQHCDDLVLAGGDHGGDRPGLGARPLRIGGVLDVATGEHLPARRANGGSYGESRVRGVSLGLYRPRGGEEVLYRCVHFTCHEPLTVDSSSRGCIFTLQPSPTAMRHPLVVNVSPSPNRSLYGASPMSGVCVRGSELSSTRCTATPVAGR